VPADQILAVTFTNKAAREMDQRLSAMRAPGAQMPTIATFHGLCRKLLQERDAALAGILADDTVRQAVMADALDQVKRRFPECSLSVGDAIEFIVAAKQQLLGPDDELDGVCPEDPDPARLRALYRTYAKLMRLQQLVDFEDLILATVRGLESDPDWRRRLRSRFAYLFVDEFQDINYGQYRLVRLLAPDQPNLCVIGDPDQAIYGFRGSDVAFFSSFSRDYPVARQIRLTHNYRSTGTILRAAYQAMASKDALHAHRTGKETIAILESPSARAEAVAVGMIVEQMVGGTGFHAIDFGKIEEGEQSCSFSDFAVLYRTNDQGRLFAEVLREAGIPCQLVSKEDRSRKRGTAKLVSLLRVMAGLGSYVDFNQLTDISAPGISRETLDLFKNWAYDNQLPLEKALHAAVRLPVQGLSTARQHRLVDLIRLIRTLKEACAARELPETIEWVLTKTTLSSQVADNELRPILDAASSHAGDLRAFLDGRALQSDTDLYQPEAERVALMTMHASKGLEFNVVFVVGCEEGLVPYTPPGGEPGDPDEERRLLFVAMTRAREQLFLSWARKRTLYGKTERRRMSSFLDPIDPQLTERLAPPGRKPSQQQLSLF
jgi:superfamily I DNA/RNA helicase